MRIACVCRELTVINAVQRANTFLLLWFKHASQLASVWDLLPASQAWKSNCSLSNCIKVTTVLLVRAFVWESLICPHNPLVLNTELKYFRAAQTMKPSFVFRMKHQRSQSKTIAPRHNEALSVQQWQENCALRQKTLYTLEMENEVFFFWLMSIRYMVHSDKWEETTRYTERRLLQKKKK